MSQLLCQHEDANCKHYSEMLYFGLIMISYGVMNRALFALALLCAYAVGLAHAPIRPKLENAKVRVFELDYEPGKPRERSIRPADQVIVFLDDSRYRRIDPETGAITIRERKSGDVIWHDKGEVAPVLANLGFKTYRTLVIELK